MLLALEKMTTGYVLCEFSDIIQEQGREYPVGLRTEHHDGAENFVNLSKHLNTAVPV
jgi:hypothetical protein